MSVRDHGIEALRKSAGQVTPGDGAEYYLLTKILDAIFQMSGLSKDWRISTILLTDVAQALPTTALTDRNSVIIHNKSATEKVYIGKTNVTADTVVGITSGWEIPANSYYALDVKDTIVIYGICETGKTATIKVMELA